MLDGRWCACRFGGQQRLRRQVDSIRHSWRGRCGPRRLWQRERASVDATLDHGLWRIVKRQRDIAKAAPHTVRSRMEPDGEFTVPDDDNLPDLHLLRRRAH